jgi:spore coat protein CotH
MCPEFSVLKRYQTTYERKSHDWKELSPDGHAELQKIIEELPAARTAGDPATRAHIEKYFDVKQLIDHWLIRNFAGTWDDSIHNYFPYKRASDGKWIIIPQDFDMDWGGDKMGIPNANFGQPPTMSFFSSGMRLKSAIMAAYRPEVTARVLEMAKTVLSEQNLNKLLDEALAEFDRDSWMAAEGKACDLDKRVAMARQFIKDRHAFLATGVK